MRTTIDFPASVLDKLRAVARDRNQTLSSLVVEMVDRNFQAPARPARILRGKSGLPVLESNGRVITTEDVRALEDEV